MAKSSTTGAGKASAAKTKSGGARSRATGGKSAGAAKKASSAKADETASGWGDAIPDALRDAGRRAADLAQNPYARSLLAAGLVAAAAALASNKNVRDTTRRNLRAATEAVEVGADNAGKVGLAIVNAATEAVQRMLSMAGAGSATPQRPASKPKAKAKAGSAKKPAATKAKATAKAAAKPKAPARAKPKTAASRPAAKAAPAAAARKRTPPKKDG